MAPGVVRSFVRPFVRSSVRSSVRPSVRSSVRPFVRPFVRSSVRSFVRARSDVHRDDVCRWFIHHLDRRRRHNFSRGGEETRNVGRTRGWRRGDRGDATVWM